MHPKLATRGTSDRRIDPPRQSAAPAGRGTQIPAPGTPRHLRAAGPSRSRQRCATSVALSGYVRFTGPMRRAPHRLASNSTRNPPKGGQCPKSPCAPADPPPPVCPAAPRCSIKAPHVAATPTGAIIGSASCSPTSHATPFEGRQGSLQRRRRRPLHHLPTRQLPHRPVAETGAGGHGGPRAPPWQAPGPA